MEEMEARKDVERRLFPQIVIISRFTKNPESYPVNSLKRKHLGVSTSLEEENIKNQNTYTLNVTTWD